MRNFIDTKIVIKRYDEGQDTFDFNDFTVDLNEIVAYGKPLDHDEYPEPCTIIYLSGGNIFIIAIGPESFKKLMYEQS